MPVSQAQCQCPAHCPAFAAAVLYLQYRALGNGVTHSLEAWGDRDNRKINISTEFQITQQIQYVHTWVKSANISYKCLSCSLRDGLASFLHLVERTFFLNRNAGGSC